MTNHYVELLKNKSAFELRYDPFGIANQIVVANGSDTTCIPKGNDHFEGLLAYIDESLQRPMPKFSWIEIVRDQDGNILHYRTDQGHFVDIENEVVASLKKQLDAGAVEIREAVKESPVIELEANIFLPREYTISSTEFRRLDHYDFNVDEIGLPFQAQVSLLQAVEPTFFASHESLSQSLKNLTGNVIRILISSKGAESIYKWSIPHLEVGAAKILSESANANLALYKRNKTRGPTSGWYFDWMTLQFYLWAPLLETANTLIGMINLQAHRKTMSLMSKDDLGDLVCIKAVRADGTYHLWPLGNLKDAQINIFPHELNWKHDDLSRSFYRVRYLLDRSLYLEAVVVAQAVLEAIVNGMFSQELSQRHFGRRELKWEQKYRELKKFFDSQEHSYLKTSKLYQYFNGDLRRIYELRNQFAHDILENKPNYSFALSTLNEIERLLKPLTDTWESGLFRNEVGSMYALRLEFLDFLVQNAEELQSGTNSGD